MKTKSLRSALAKTKAVVTVGDLKKHSATVGDRVMEWWESPSGHAECVRVRLVYDHDDYLSDYHAGYYPRTMRDALDYLLQRTAYKSTIESGKADEGVSV